MITRLASSATNLLASRAALPVPPLPSSCLVRPSRSLQVAGFSTTCPRFDNPPPNHYEVLQVQPDCTPAELKKQFYTLSRATHPDVNRNDPKAGERFSQISESYSVLADPDKRRRYDRDHLPRHHQHHRHRGHGGPAHTGSYAGSRPPSGLSKRRGTFRGPPPSFYAHGSTQQNKSSSANNSWSTSSDSASNSSSSSSTTGPTGGTFNAGAYSSNPDPDFDPQPTFRTQTHEDTRRQSRRAAAMAAAQKDMEDESNFWARVLVVTGIVVGAITIGSVVSGSMATPRGGLTRADGSRRDGPRNSWAKG